jgi:hypothetical protein
VQEVLSHEDEELIRRLAERARDAAYFIQGDLGGLARAAARRVEVEG